MSKIVDKWWFTTGGGTIGIVKTIDDVTGEQKFRIGIASGIDEDLDALSIKNYGARFFPEMIK